MSVRLHNMSVIVSILLLLAACDNNDNEATHEVYEHSGSTMGTSFNVNIVSPPASTDMQKLLDDVVDTLTQIDRRLSTYDANSELSKFNQSNSVEWISVSSEMCDLIESSIQLSDLTTGAFDITVGPLVNLWGFGPDGSITEPPANDAVSAALARVGYRGLQTNCTANLIRKDRTDIYVDLSAYAKGYAVDRVADLLARNNVVNYLVEVGGEVRVAGVNGANTKWKIAIERPLPGRRTVETLVHLSTGAVATSGDYRNFFEHLGNRYSHAIDVGTGRPITHDATAVTVISGSAGMADAMATALLVMGPEVGLKFATAHDLAAYFQIHDADGFEYLATPPFNEYLAKP